MSMVRRLCWPLHRSTTSAITTASTSGFAKVLSNATRSSTFATYERSPLHAIASSGNQTLQCAVDTATTTYPYHSSKHYQTLSKFPSYPFPSKHLSLSTPPHAIQKRFVARIRAHRYRGTTAVKVHAPKTQWYLQAEKQFLQERNAALNGYVALWQPSDIATLHPKLRLLLHLDCASKREIHKWRKLQLRRRFQRMPFDTGSAAVKLAMLTENILNLREHMIKHPKDHGRKRTMSIWLARRQKCMKYLYQTDFPLYKQICNALAIKLVLFAIPDSRSRQQAISPMAVDGDRCKFLIRQKLWKGRYRPRRVRLPDGQTVAYTRHPMEEPPENLNKPVPHVAEVSQRWPYGIREERIKGKYRIYNPTAAGPGYCPVPMLF